MNVPIPASYRMPRVKPLAPLFLLLTTALLAQSPGVPPPIPGTTPRPEPTEREKEEEIPPEAPAEPESEEPWGIEDELKDRLGRQAERYREYALRFTCTETVRSAKYDGSGEATNEESRRYAYLLDIASDVTGFREVRQRMKPDGTVRNDEVKDEEPFPPAYGWVFLFSSFNQPYFTYRHLGERFEGFDWVYEIEFRGALPFTDGKDIRQWEGVALVDAVTMSPIEIHAEPSRQKERVKAIYDQWRRAFSLAGIKFAPRPFGYRCRVIFQLRQDRLAFPTELRYDTFRAVSPKRNEPWRASSRSYADYKFFRIASTEKPETPEK